MALLPMDSRNVRPGELPGLRIASVRVNLPRATFCAGYLTLSEHSFHRNSKTSKHDSRVRSSSCAQDPAIHFELWFA
jgi:hypothetical protein